MCVSQIATCIQELVGLGLLWAALVTPVLATDLTTTGDTYTQASSPTANFGSSGITAVAVGRVTLIQFDPTAVAQSSGAQALLKIKVLIAKNYTDGVTAHLVTSTWSEKTVTAKTMPSIASAVLDQKTITAANQGQIVSFDVSGALAGWRNNPSANFGIALVAGSPTPNLQLGSREGGSPAILSLGGVVADNDVTVAVSGGDYPDPQTAANNAFAGDKWCVSPQPPTKPCTIHVKAGFYPNGGISLPPGLALIGEGRGSTILIGNLGFSNGLVSDLTIRGNATFIEALGPVLPPRPSGYPMEFERFSLNARDQEEIFDLRSGGAGLFFQDSDITGINTRPNQPSFTFDCGTCSIKMVHCRVTVIADGGVDGFDYAQDATQSLDLEDTSMFAGGISVNVQGLDVTVSDSQIIGGIGGNKGDDSLRVLNSTIIGGIGWDDFGSVTLDGATVDSIHAGPAAFGSGTPVSIMRSTVGDVSLKAGKLDVESSVIAGDLSLSSSTGALSSSQVAGKLTLTTDPDFGTPSTATCNRVFDGQLNLLPPNCVRQ